MKGHGPICWERGLVRKEKGFVFWEALVCCVAVCVCVLSVAQLCPTLLPFATPGDLPDPGIEPVSLAFPALAGGFFTTIVTWE